MMEHGNAQERQREQDEVERDAPDGHVVLRDVLARVARAGAF